MAIARLLPMPDQQPQKNQQQSQKQRDRKRMFDKRPEPDADNPAICRGAD